MSRVLVNKRLKQFLHVAFWAYMFLSPMQFMRGTGMPMSQYWMNCMGQLLMMVMFYANYLWLTPRYFVSGKHRYFLMFNTVLVLCFVVFLHYWSDFTHLRKDCLRIGGRRIRNITQGRLPCILIHRGGSGV